MVNAKAAAAKEPALCLHGSRRGGREIATASGYVDCPEGLKLGIRTT